MKRITRGVKAGSDRGPSTKEGAGRTVRSRKKGADLPKTLSEERYKAFIENIDDGVYEVDLRGKFTYFNNALCEVFGHPRRKIQGESFSKFMDEERARAAFEIFNEVYRSGKGVFDLTWEIIDQKGGKRIIELSANLITDSRGEKTGFRGIARDVTERFKAQDALRESELRYQKAYEASRSAERRNRILLDFLPYPMVVFTAEGRVSYLNPAFTETFGWTLEELQGKHIPYVPPDLQEEVQQSIRKLLRDKVILRHESRRLTKDGRILDVMMRGTVFSEDGDTTAGEMVLLRDITQEKRLQRINDALLRISMALPAHPDLEELLDYISGEIKRLLEVEGALVILLDEEKKELFFLGAAYDDKATELRAKEIRYPADRGVSGSVIRTGQPVIVHDTSKAPSFYSVVDRKLGHVSRSLLDVPLRSGDRIIGVLCAINKKEGVFDEKDVELLNMIGGTVALSIENARFAEEIKHSYREVSSLNRAKSRVINRLSHELRTPIAVLMASLNILGRRLSSLPAETWGPTLDRARRNLQRLLDIQHQVEDIMEGRQDKTYEVLNLLLDQCEDQLEALAAEQGGGEGILVEAIRSRIRELYGRKESKIAEIPLHRFVQDRVEALRPEFAHRQVEVTVRVVPGPDICLPADVLQKVTDGLLRNAVEATPDEGTVEITVEPKGGGAELRVSDRGIGITEENQGRIFEGFFTTQETMSYSSGRPFDFNAGGKGADLLRMKIFAERYNFRIGIISTRCRHIPRDSDLCPGRISLCRFCAEMEDCRRSGGTTFTVYFPPAPPQGCETKDKPAG